MKAAESAEPQTGTTQPVIEKLPRRVLSAASRVHGYFPALAAFGVAILLHCLILYLFSPPFPGILVIYTAAMLFGAWCGYGPGILVVVLAASVVPYLSRPDFSLRQIDPGGLAALVLLSVLVSRMAEGRRRRETMLLNVNAELDRRVQAQTVELERTNRSLEHQVAELETLYAKSPIGLSLLDKDLRFVRINEKLASINGSSVSDHQGRRLHEMVARPIADIIGPLFRSVLETGTPVLNYELRDPSSQPGAEKDWLIDCAPVKAENGSAIGLQIVVQDITERKRGEKALAQANHELRQSEEQFRLLANAIPQLCWMANADGWIFWYNDRWYEYTGLTPERLAGWGWQEVHHPDFLPRVLAQWELSIATGQPFEMVFPLRAADGAFRTFLTRVHPLKDAQGHVLRWFGTNTDITERMRIEEALQQTNEALHRANEDLGQFAYIAAHDLQEPLRTIVSFSQLVQRRAGCRLDADSQEWLGHVVAAGVRMSHLIRDVLAYSRATAESERVVQNVNLNEVLATALDSLQTRILETQAQIVHDSLPVIEGDAARLGQVFQNLLSNALKYQREGSIPEISIRATRRNREWLFTIRDNGQGFSQDYADKIFGIFKRLHGVELPGSGIGLAICKTVIERHGGRIWAESENGHGAAFHFTLPAGTREGTYER